MRPGPRPHECRCRVSGACRKQQRAPSSNNPRGFSASSPEVLYAGRIELRTAGGTAKRGFVVLRHVESWYRTAGRCTLKGVRATTKARIYAPRTTPLEASRSVVTSSQKPSYSSGLQRTKLQPQSVVTNRGVGARAFRSSTPGGAHTPTVTPAESRRASGPADSSY